MTAPVDIWDSELVAAARGAMTHAHAPYSRFAVGAALRLADGTIITGTNFENASFGLSLCAETVAIANANSSGQITNILAIAIIGGAMEHRAPEASTRPLTPCGRCRQVIAEAAMLAHRDIQIYCAPLVGDERATYRASELLPHAFSGEDFSSRP